ncbi:zinc finger protein 2-like [Cynara cardunculus var. scolymus]|uniref:Zinc finger, C2H2 n=1 Tax=Cynara cardunculus var. scolymus TaxID=59895 RepID=A0A103YKG3_CYNCS|nr:zinc finger protein 2-like [Cynara cardunculus var. scolymus]KVI10819.1 Zinc finger, C2H2 [Cynara cardunculus var. scolymus]
MSTRKDGGEEEGWLNLRLGQNEGSSCVRSRSTSMKVYACSFCGRKLHSPQALGGHQNAHRRERDSARRYPAFHVKQSTDVDSHLLARTPGTDDETTVARFADNGAGYGVASVQLYAAERAVDLKSSGSSYSYPEPSSDQFDPNTLDLNLKL